MKNTFLKYVYSSGIIVVLFILVHFIFYDMSIVDETFWFAIILLLLAFFGKKDSSVLPFGKKASLMKNSKNTEMQSDYEANLYQTKTDNKNINRANKRIDRIYREFNNENESNNLSFTFFVYGVIFSLICVILTYFIYL